MNAYERIMKALSHTECDECGTQIKVSGANENHIQTELGFANNMGGGYGEFIDAFDLDTYVVLCHDCTATMFAAIPNVANRWIARMGTKGWHPYEGDTPCCPFGWTFTQEEE
jgi:hypothetical protein